MGRGIRCRKCFGYINESEGIGPDVGNPDGWYYCADEWGCHKRQIAKARQLVTEADYLLTQGALAQLPPELTVAEILWIWQNPEVHHANSV